MAITDIDISETLETNAPSIKYRGNEGPKSPQEEQMIMEQQQMAAVDPMMKKKLKLIEELMSQGYDFGSASNLADKIMSGQDEQDIGMASGGIAGLDGRVRYGIGSSLKKRIRKLIPNEVAKVAEVAAPFVAPFNPLAAGLMSGIGGFDRHGSIGKGLKSGLMNYGLGQGARYLGGAGFQTGINPMTGSGVQGAGFFSKPTGTETGIGKWLDSRKPAFTPSGNQNVRLDQAATLDDWAGSGKGMEAVYADKVVPKTADVITKTKPGSLLKTIKDFALDNKAMLGILGVSAAAAAGMGAEDVEDIGEMDRGAPLKIREIRSEVIEAFKDPSGEKLAALRIKYPFLGAKETKNLDLMAEGGRIGLNMGGRPLIESAYNLRQRQLAPLGSPGAGSRGHFTQKTRRTDLAGGGYTTGGTGYNKPGYLGGMASRRPMEEGGIMDLGGMEKDYRAEGGFVPIGKEEKADDVPARLSVNEFVMTADAVRGAGGGDIDKGAEIMENVMKNLEKGGRISEESQGLKGAQEMFEVSERLSEVV